MKFIFLVERKYLRVAVSKVRISEGKAKEKLIYFIFFYYNNVYPP